MLSTTFPTSAPLTMESSSTRGPATFQYFSLLYFPFIHSTQVQTRMFHQELLQPALAERRSQPTHLRLISLIVLLYVFHLNTSRQNTKQSLRLSPCVTDWRQRVARWSIYFQLTGASTIQYRWHKHKLYWLQHCTFTDQLAQVVLPTGGAYLRHHAGQTFPGGERLSS